MSILYDSTRRVKSKPTRFGRGILASRPVHRLPVTLADLDWAARELNEPEPDWDRMAAEAEALARYERGYLL
jgi:hypothetical protein